jgi:4-hydroxy 2-oxovalerate aldolase
MFFDNIAKPVVLDVTLRDGGYLNGWMFSETHIRRAVEAAINLGADMIEVGYLDDRDGVPVAASWKPEYLKQYSKIRNRVAIAAMCRPMVENPEHVIESRKELLDLVRIPVDLRNTHLANKLAAICEKHAVPISFNLTGLSLYTVRQITEAMSQLSDYASIAYLADSRGALRPHEVKEIHLSLQTVWKGRFGFHAHNSLGLAVENTEMALDHGCESIDGSLFGIGLGGRNLDLREAIRLARVSRKDLPVPFMSNGLDESGLGVPPSKDEKAVFYLAAEKNIKMEWIALMIEQIGTKDTLKAIADVPWGTWFTHEEMKRFIDPIIWRRIIWS